MGLKNLNIKLLADLSQFSTSMQNADRQMKKMAKSMESTGKSMSLYITAPLMAVGAVGVKGFLEADANLTKLNSSIAANGKDVESTSKQYQDFASKMQSMTTMEDDAVIGFLQLAEAMKAPDAQKAVQDAIGISKAYGVDMDSALKAVVKAQEGQYTALGKLVPAIKNAKTESEKAAIAQEIYASSFKVAQAETETAAGKIEQMKNSLGNATEVIGGVIVDGLSPLIDWVKTLADWFQGLSKSQAQWVVGIGGTIAAIGPLLIGAAKMITTFQTLGPLFTTIKTAFSSLTTTIMANPWTAALTAVVALTAAFVIYSETLGKVSAAQQAVDDVMAAANKNVAEEKTKSEQLVSIASNTTLAYNDRKKALSDLIALSPQHLKNLTLENLNTEQGVSMLKKYNEQLQQKAVITAAQDKLVELEKKMIDVRSKGINQDLSTFDKISSFVAGAVTPGGDIALKQAAGVKELTNAEKDYAEQKAALTKIINETTTAMGGYTAASTASGNVTKQSAKESADALKEEFQLRKLKAAEIRDVEARMTEEAKIALDEKINGYKKEIQNIELRNRLIKKATDEYKDQVDMAKEAGANPITFMATRELKPADIPSITVDPINLANSLKDATDELHRDTPGFIDRLQLIKDAVQDFNDNMKTMVKQFATDSVAKLSESFGSLVGDKTMTAQQKWKKMFGVFLGLIADFASNMGKMLIGIGVAGMAFTKSLESMQWYVALAAGAALVAGAAALNYYISSSAEKFAGGGIVGGTSFSGDKIPAMVNSGEMILNNNQQGRLFNMLNGATTTGNPMKVEIVGKLSGQDIRLSNLRASNRYNRI